MKKYYLLAAITILAWSTLATVSKLLLGSFNSMQVLCVSSLFAALGVLIVSIATKKIKLLKEYSPKDYIKMILIGLPGSLIYYVFYYMGTARMPASQAFIVNYLWPIMSVIFACILLKEKVTSVKVIAIMLSFAGVIISIGKELLAFEASTLIGATFCALGAVSYGVFTALNQNSKYDKGISMMLSFFATFVITAIAIIFTNNIPTLAATDVLGFAWNGMIAMGIANMTWILALGAKDTAKISTLAYITPFLSMIWTFLILKEKIELSSIIGLAIIVFGIMIQIFFSKKDKDVSIPQSIENNSAKI